MFRRLLVMLALPAALWVGPALAQESPDIGSDRAVELAREQAAGRVLGVERRIDREPPVYEVKILQDDGHVRTIRISAASGDSL